MHPRPLHRYLSMDESSARCAWGVEFHAILTLPHPPAGSVDHFWMEINTWGLAAQTPRKKRVNVVCSNVRSIFRRSTRLGSVL